jgi:cytochrome c553
MGKDSEMNNEPVAWTVCLDCGKRVTGDSIHTCSPQLKTLTDEEIEKVVHELNQKARTPERWVTAMEMGAETIIQLRNELAILRKAQEK